ncbi:MAG: nucleoside phosphorylase [Cytophagales bacterium]|nr:nucleoside phosphorylase [Cytophagales bacterium]
MSKVSQADLIINPDGSIYHLNLKPDQITDFIITVGDPGRVYRVSQHFDDIEFEMNKREFITHVGNYKGKRVMVMSTGMGTDNIEIVLTELDALANVDFKTRKVKDKKRKLQIIRIGTSGSLQIDLKCGSYLVSDYGVGFDTLMSFYDLPQTEFEKLIVKELKEKIELPFLPYCVKGSDELKRKFAFDMIEGNTVTCPGFYAPQGRYIRVKSKFNNLIEDLNYFHYDNFWLTNFEMETAGYYALGRLLGHEILSVNAILANRIENKFSKNPAKIIDSLIVKILDRI